jgi:hydrogenase maturation factor
MLIAVAKEKAAALLGTLREHYPHVQVIGEVGPRRSHSLVVS